MGTYDPPTDFGARTLRGQCVPTTANALVIVRSLPTTANQVSSVNLKPLAHKRQRHDADNSARVLAVVGNMPLRNRHIYAHQHKRTDRTFSKKMQILVEKPNTSAIVHMLLIIFAEGFAKTSAEERPKRCNCPALAIRGYMHLPFPRDENFPARCWSYFATYKIEP